jgi:hypothetical protein
MFQLYHGENKLIFKEIDDQVRFLLNAACFTEKQHKPNCISRSQSTTFEAITLTITPPIYSTSDTRPFTSKQQKHHLI